MSSFENKIRRPEDVSPKAGKNLNRKRGRQFIGNIFIRLASQNSLPPPRTTEGDFNQSQKRVRCASILIGKTSMKKVIRDEEIHPTLHSLHKSLSAIPALPWQKGSSLRRNTTDSSSGVISRNSSEHECLFKGRRNMPARVKPASIPISLARASRGERRIILRLYLYAQPKTTCPCPSGLPY